MKKIAMLAVMTILSISAFAQVRILQNGKITVYEKGATINISSKEAVEVYYDGVLITIPQGKKVVISQNKAGNLLIKGDNLNGVKVIGQTLKAEKPSTYIVYADKKTVMRMPTQATPADNKQNFNKKQNVKNTKQNTVNNNPATSASANASQTVQETAIEVSFPEAEQFVNEIVNEQAVQDVEEQLSPSTSTDY